MSATPPATPGSQADADRARSVLRNRAFLRLWAGTTGSGVATWALPFLLGLGLVEGDVTASTLGLLLAVRTLGFLVAVPVAGVLADRHTRRSVVYVAGLVAGTSSFGLSLTWADQHALAALAVLAIGAGQGACRPGFQALTAEVIDEAQRQEANAMTTLAVRLSVVIAPGLTAAFAQFVDLEVIIAASGLLWLAAALLPPPGRRHPEVESPRWSYLAEFGAGLIEARRHTWFLPGLGALAVVVMLGYSSTWVALPLVSEERYGGGAVLAAGATAYTIGGAIGGILTARWRPTAMGWWALAGLASYAVAPLALALAAPAVTVVAAYVVAGLGIVVFNVPWFTATQREVDPAMLARVSSVDFLVSYGLAPVGLALLGPAMNHFGSTATLIVCATGCLVAPAVAATVSGARGFTRVSQ